MYSKRKFKVVGFETGHDLSIEISVNQLFDKKEDSELIYTLQEITDKVLDMNVGETLFIDLNRDNCQGKGVILRTE